MVESRAWSYRGSHGTLVARTWTARDSQPSHIALIAHGYGEHIGRYDRVAEAFVRNGAVVYGVDHLRHGKSHGERVLIADFEEVASDFHLLDEQARREHPGFPVVLLGHSMGGWSRRVTRSAMIRRSRP
jgi:alpha-beta hydrolase superfamily lysophospholipase